MKRSYLVQRLVPRQEGRMGDLANSFAFGGGLVNGGLSPEAMKILPFRFDYMGAAEFEFGAAPKALNQMTQHALVGGVTDTNHGDVFYICNEANETEVTERISEWAFKPYSGNTKEMVGLHQALTEDGWRHGVCGWLELDNGFAFFTDEQMWRDTAAMFGVELLPEVAA